MIYSFGEWDWGSEEANMVKYEAIVQWLEERIGPSVGMIDCGHYEELETDLVFNRTITQFLLLSQDKTLLSGPGSWKHMLKFHHVVCHHHPLFQVFLVTTRHIDGRGPCHLFAAIRDDAIIVQLKLMEVESPDDLLIKVIDER